MTFNLDTFIPYITTHTGAVVSDAFANVYQDVLSNPQWRIVCHLLQAQSPLTVKQVCDKAMLDKSTASRAVGELQSIQWLDVQPCAHDKRAKKVCLSDYGREQFAAITPQALAWQQQLLAAFDEREKAMLITLLEKLARQAAGIKKAHQ